ncbi:MAG: thiamine phosphate synthase [Thiobacillus sp.]|nr:thiamine phosphate synthase [Thiobacillus sp.]
MSNGLRGLYAITPDWSDSKRLVAVSEAILAAGCRLLQYRNKAASPCHRQEQAVALRGLTRRFDALLIVNDDLDLALFCEADGVHLGEDDGELAQARALLGADKILGASCYQDPGLAEKAARAGADYVAFGSFFPSPTKPHARRAHPELLAAGKAVSGKPVCVIGGITVENSLPLIKAGADMVAVISALYDAPDPAVAAKRFISLFNNPQELA